MKNGDDKTRNSTNSGSGHLRMYTRQISHGPNDGPGDVGTPKAKWILRDPAPKRTPSTEGNGERI